MNITYIKEIEIMILEYLFVEYIPKLCGFVDGSEKCKESVKISFKVKSRNIDNIGFLSEFDVQSNNLLQEFVRKNKAPTITNLCIILNDTVLIGLIIYINNEKIDAIEGHTYAEDWPDEMLDCKIITTKQLNKLMSLNTKQGNILREKYS